MKYVFYAGGKISSVKLLNLVVQGYGDVILMRCRWKDMGPAGNAGGEGYFKEAVVFLPPMVTVMGVQEVGGCNGSRVLFVLGSTWKNDED